MGIIASNFELVEQRIGEALSRAGRTRGSLTVVAVSKGQTVQAMKTYAEACSLCGLPVVFGESYLQEIERKRGEMPVKSSLHFIGRLQSNKIPHLVRCCEVIESVSSLKALKAIDSEAQSLGKRQRIMLQVNISGDEGKSGFSADEIQNSVPSWLSELHNVSCLGLMTITRLYAEREDVRSDFIECRELQDSLASKSTVRTIFENERIALSMGMSQDYDIAIEEGATLVRIGTAIFGSRD